MKKLAPQRIPALAMLVTIIGGVVPWARLIIRGHVEFCQGSCPPPDWFDYAETLGRWLSLGIPILACWFAIQHKELERKFKPAMWWWLTLLICATASTLTLDFYQEAFINQEYVWRPFPFL